MGFRDDSNRYGLAQTFCGRLFGYLERYLGLHVWRIFVRPIAPVFEMPPEHAERFECKRLTLEETLESSNDAELHLAAAFVRDAFARGDICVGAFDGGSLVAYAWRTLQSAPVTSSLWLKLCRDDVRYGYKSFVRPAYRGMSLHHTVSQFYEHNFTAMGITQAIAYVPLNNLASLQSHRGFNDETAVGHAGYLEFGHRLWTFRTPRVRAYLAFEIHEPADARIC